MVTIASMSSAIFLSLLYAAYKRNALRAPDVEFGGRIWQDLGP